MSMDQSQPKHLSYALSPQITNNPIQNTEGPPHPMATRPYPLTSQPSTSKNPLSPPPEGRRITNQHNLSSSSEELLDTQPAHHNGWQQIRKTKRKKIQASVHTVPPSQTETSNRYEMLAEESGSTHPTQVTKPPPIFLHGVLNFSEMMKSLTEVVEEEQFYTKSLANNVIKIVCLTPDTYRKIVTHRKERNIYYHTYQLKEERAFRVSSNTFITPPTSTTSSRNLVPWDM